DAASVMQVIDRWVAKNGRERSPRYLIGESYGTTRIGAILHDFTDARFDGVVLISTVGGNDGPPYMAFARGVPSMAVSAWYHEKIPRNGRTVDQVWDEATKFVKTEYVPALAKGDSLSPAEKSRVAERLSSLTGLPVDFVQEKNIRLTPQDWLMNILKD